MWGSLVSILLTMSGADPAPTFVHRGMCDASGAVAVGRSLFVVANDEDNLLRVYRRGESGVPVAECDLNAFLAIDPKHPEADFEAAAAIGQRVYWITSHGTSKEGKPRPNRRRLLATDVKTTADGAVQITPVGKPYDGLVAVLDSNPATARFELGRAAEKRPESRKGLNIEGLAATPDGRLLIGLRNPRPDNKALIVPLENPEEVIQGQPPRLGQPILLDLGGLGIRSLEYFAPRQQYLIVAGPHDSDGNFRLYRWSPPAGPAAIAGVDFGDLRPEALFAWPDDSSGVEVLSDDGTRDVDGLPCKQAEPAKRSFRSRWLNF